MNSAMLAMIPRISNNQVQPSNPSVSNTKMKFGAVLENALATDDKASLGQLEQSTEERTLLEDLLSFMKLDSVTDLEEGVTAEDDALLKLLMKLNGEDESAVAEFLASIVNGGLFVSGEDTKISLDGKKLSLDEAAVMKQEIQQLVAHLTEKVENMLGSEASKQLFSEISPDLATIMETLKGIDTTAVMQQEIQQLVDSVTKKVEHTLSSEANKQLLAEVAPHLATMLTTLNRVDVNDLSTVDLQAMVNVLKLAKLQDLVSGTKQVSPEEAVVQQEIKQLIESLTEKIEKSLSNPSFKSGNEASLATLLEKGSYKSLDIVRQAYAQSFNTDKEADDETVSNGLTLKTAESNTQSSLPFQMTKLEQYVLTASKNGQPVDVEQFVKSFEKIVSKANFSNANGTQKLLIRLNPDNLGSLRIELIQKDGAMIAKILTTTTQAKDLLDRQVQGLKHAFTNQNIQVEKIEVAQQLSTFNAERFAPRDQGQGQGQHEQQQQQAKQNVNEDEETKFTDRFEEALLNVEV